MTQDLNTRIERHNSGREKITKAYRPFKLIFAQECVDRKKARDLEKYLKVRYNKESLLELIARVAKLVDAHA